LTQAEAAQITVAAVLGGTDKWNPLAVAKHPAAALANAAPLPANKFDFVLAARVFHGWAGQGRVDANLANIYNSLKPGGVLALEQHRGNPGQEPPVNKGYVTEQAVIDAATKAGFKLDGKSEVNANPKDTKDHPEGVWTLPPTLRLGETDKAKYLAIGESDRMTLRFVKVAKKP